MNKIITRFAPSPTGYLHFGNIRTALFSWLYAKKHNGIFYLRIDDTDIKRNKNVYYNNIIKDLNWLGLNWFGNPILQSKKIRLYNEIAKNLINNNLAYKCYCNKERIENIKYIQKKLNENIKYDGKCKYIKNIKNKNNYVIRFKTPDITNIIYTDVNKGKIETNIKEIDDFIIIKSNNIPTYNFCSTIDDIEMKITDIIRGDDHIKNTAKHIILTKVLEKNIPKFTHLPLIIDNENKPLSKRDIKNQLDYYKKNGYIPNAILNYLLRLGWSYKNKEIFTIDEMIKFFNTSNINKSPAKFDINKLLWMNKYYIKNMENINLGNYLEKIIIKNKLNKKINTKLEGIINIQKNRSYTLLDMINNSKYLFGKNIKKNKELGEKINKDIITKIYNELNNMESEWTIENIKINIKNIITKNNIILSDIANQLRLMLTEKNDHGPIFEIIYYIGKKITINRLKKYIT